MDSIVKPVRITKRNDATPREQELRRIEPRIRCATARLPRQLLLKDGVSEEKLGLLGAEQLMDFVHKKLAEGKAKLST